MSRFFKPYEGKRSYLFISYSHRQSDAVIDTIRLLHERRWRIWYDEGIPAGSDWPKNIESHMRGSAAVLFFLSRSALDSPNCFSEIKTALEQRKSVLVLPLEKAEIPAAWDALLAACRFLPAADTAEERAAAVEKSGVLTGAFRRRALEGLRTDGLGLAAALLIFALTAGAVYGLFTGRIALPGTESAAQSEAPAPTPGPTPRPDVDMSPWESLFPVVFPDKQQEDAVRGLLGNAEEDVLLRDLPQIRALYFCGNMTLKKLAGIRFDDDGQARVNTARVIDGKVSDLSVIGRMPNLEELALICQPVTDLGALSELTLLRELSLAGDGELDLAALGAQPSLETLHLEHSGVRDLSALEQLSALQRVTVSAEMLPLRWNEGAGFDVILVP